MNTIVPITGF